MSKQLFSATFFGGSFDSQLWIGGLCMCTCVCVCVMKNK